MPNPGRASDSPVAEGSPRLPSGCVLVDVAPRGASASAVAVPPSWAGGAAGPARPISVREWFVSNHCTADDVAGIVAVQQTCPSQDRVWTPYFLLWTHCGSGEFYTALIALLVWAGLEADGVHLCVVLSVGLYVTDVLKDLFACPRPPCPPVRRAGAVSHANEYGWPSTHTACACLLAWEVAELASRADIGFPERRALWWGLAAVFAAQVSFSRVYLGMHWVADVVGGIAVFAVVEACDTLFVDAALAALLRRFDVYPLWFPLLAGHLALVFHAAPRDPCPCFEDSVRFVGVDVGAIIGVWCRQRWRVPLVRVPVDGIATAAFAGRYAGSLVVVLVVRVLVQLALKRSLPPLLTFLAGAGKPSSPAGGRAVAPRGWLHPRRILGIVSGVLLGKFLYLGHGGSAAEFGTNGTGEGAAVAGSPTSTGGTASGGASGDNCGNDGCGENIVLACGDEKSACCGHSNATGSGDSGKQSGGVGYWTLRNHDHWWEYDIITKFGTYLSMGVAVTWLAPAFFVWLHTESS